MAQQSGEQIREHVRKHYAGVARRATAACCGPSETASDCCDSADAALSEAGVKVLLYTKEETGGLPDAALLASAGCGNPAGLASLREGETVVDFGSGGGIDCFLAARAVGPRGKVIGVDMTPEMIALARSNAAKLGASNVEFHLAQMENTPLGDGSADVLISNCVICLAPDKDAVFREAFRVLRPGGRVFVSDMVLERALPREIAESPEQWASCVAGAEPKDVYLDRVRRAGFVGIDVLSATPSRGGRTGVVSMSVRAAKPA